MNTDKWSEHTCRSNTSASENQCFVKSQRANTAHWFRTTPTLLLPSKQKHTNFSRGHKIVHFFAGGFKQTTEKALARSYVSCTTNWGHIFYHYLNFHLLGLSQSVPRFFMIYLPDCLACISDNTDQQLISTCPNREAPPLIFSSGWMQTETNSQRHQNYSQLPLSKLQCNIISMWKRHIPHLQW